MSDRSVGSTSPGIGGASLTQMAIAAGKNGDPEGIHYLYVRFGDDVLRRISGLILDPELGIEVTRKVFAGLGDAIAAYDADELPFEVWLLEEARRRTLAYPSRRTSPRDSARSISAR